MKRNVHYVLSSHWDREWYQTFQDYRARLVHLLDRTIDSIESGKLRGPFTADGQAIVLDDYLEVRTHRRAQVEKLAREGKLIIGPWFVLPDEWLVSGESLIRNIRLGRQTARDYGATPSAAGFVCDLFGHISQMPQLLAGFGVKGALVWRGIEPRKSAHLNWRGPDGTTLPCYRFGRTGYCDYSYDVRHSHQHDSGSDEERAKLDLKTYIEREAARSTLPPVILFDGGDHLEYDQKHYDVLMAAKFDGFEIKHSTLDAYLDEMIEHADQITDTFDGEMREPAKLPGYEDKQWLIPGVLSSRVWIKQWNAKCQTLLCQWAEPLTAMAAALTGKGGADDYLAVAWRWLLMNHPHDSICGCSIDAVHEDMKYRFAQCEQIAERQANDAALAITASIKGNITANELRVALFNPLPRAMDEVVELPVQIPIEWPSFNEFFGFEPKPAFHVFDAEGNELPYQRLAQAMNRTKVRIDTIKYPQAYKTNDVTIALWVKIPAMGYTTLTFRAAEERKPYAEEGAAIEPTRWPTKPGLATSERSMENERISVTIEANGTLTLVDKASDQTYVRLLTFEDISDIGDGWCHGQAMNDQAFVSSASRSDVALLHDGPELCRFRVRTTLSVPAFFDFTRMVRSETFVDLVIDSTLTLRKGGDRAEVRTKVNNLAKDHRLRVLLPSGAAATTYLADGAFDVVERDIALPKDDHKGRELSVETRPQQSWTCVSDKKRGLAVISSGLIETAVRDDRDRTLALTLFRSTQRTVMTDGEPNGELLGEVNFHYWIAPLSGEPNRVTLSEDGVRLAAGVRYAQMRQADVAIHRVEGRALPPSASAFEVVGDVVVTSTRQVGEAFEVRAFNPNTTKASFTVSRPGTKSAERVNFESNVLEALKVKDGSTKVPIGPKQIVTLRLS